MTVACCRWTPIDFAQIESDRAATPPEPGQEHEDPSDAGPAAGKTDLAKMP